jgi:hypothetical protein
MKPARSLAAFARRVATGCVALLALAACSPDAPNVMAPPAPPNLAAVGNQDDLGPARAAQARHTGRLLEDRDLLGTAIGRLSDGRPEITVFARNAAAASHVSNELDGVPVVVEVTGDITALPAVANAAPHARPGSGSVKPTDYARPAYIGMSTGNAKECASGTIGAKVSRGGTIYALSNNHVFARQNAASANETIYQPGRYDLNCATGAQYAWAQLGPFKAISFNSTNTVDVAIAMLNDATQLNAWTPPDGYGAPSTNVTSASLNQAVMKYGRTTGLTTGVVVGVNVTIRVQYTDGVATFVDQIQIIGDKGSFSRAGDSGSLIVTRTGRNPVGLLFAGGQTSTFANRIDLALQAVGASILSQ